MKTGILVTARLGSTRLKRKHLLKVDGQEIIIYLTKRVHKEFEREIASGLAEIIIATSSEPENTAFNKLTGSGVAVFFGSPDNIPLRHLQTARNHDLDYIVSIDGDDILCSVAGMRKVYAALINGEKYVKTTNLPFGMNSMGYSRAFLEESLSNHGKEILETGWGRIFDSKSIYEISMPFPVNSNKLRFTLDYKEDFEFFTALIEIFGSSIIGASDEEIVDEVVKRELYKINRSIADQYWSNFNSDMQKEVQKNES